ncbi:RNA-binding protein NOB1 isoform X2 [Varanus komodoensis]|uniref:RNA-binding protein NOB1 isoform X2 n=1 Tax=Varanus komodoensis TaxID=61221 RepID=UPI001CF7C70D|nr:RNA-binding protein NOB1 isoform X2 [Varanus komodoensis]
MAPVEHVVADAGAFLRGAPLQEIGRNIYTIREVVTEIRDKETRQRLAVLPYQLHFKQPFPEYVRLVTEFSKKTGDYPSLSATDIQVLALTYQLEAEHVGVAHLRKDPEQKVTLNSTTQHPEAMVRIAGFHLPSKAQRSGGEQCPSAVDSRGSGGAAGPEASEFSSFLFWRTPLPSIEEDLRGLLADAVQAELEQPGSRESDEEAASTEEEEEEEKEGWITPSNLKQVQQELGQGDEPAGVQVGCVTTDFAMQDDLRHEPPLLPPLREQDTEEDGGDGAGRREPPAALLPEPKGLEPTRTPAPASCASGGQAREQPPPDRGPALPPAAALAQGPAEDRCLPPGLRRGAVSLRGERHLQPSRQPPDPGRGAGRRQEAPESQHGHQKVCEEEVKWGGAAALPRSPRVAKGRPRFPAAPGKAGLAATEAAGRRDVAGLSGGGRRLGAPPRQSAEQQRCS